MIVLRNKEFAYKAGKLEEQIKEAREGMLEEYGHSLPKHNEKQLRHVLRKAGNLEKKKGVAATEDAIIDYGALLGAKKRRDRVTDRINEENVIEARNNLRERARKLKFDRMIEQENADQIVKAAKRKKLEKRRQHRLSKLSSDSRRDTSRYNLTRTLESWPGPSRYHLRPDQYDTKGMVKIVKLNKGVPKNLLKRLR